MSPEKSMKGWTPELGEALSPDAIIENAFDYRGNVTLVKTDGSECIGYVFNRDRTVAEPFLQYLDEKGDGPFTLAYAETANIKFTGKDTAAGKSWEAWQARKQRGNAERDPRGAC